MDEEQTQKTLSALNDMRIKFPGKSDDEAEYILDKVSLKISHTNNSVIICRDSGFYERS